MAYVTSTQNGQRTTIGLGWIATLIAASFLIFQPTIEEPEARIRDDAGVLLPDELSEHFDALRSIARGLGAHVVVVTRDAVEPVDLPAAANRTSIELDESQGWLGRHMRPRSGHSVTVFYSRKPDLVQVRFGRYVGHLARLSGIDTGEGYRALQSIRRPDGRPDFPAIFRRVQTSFESVDVGYMRGTLYKLVVLLDGDLLQAVSLVDLSLWSHVVTVAAVPLYNLLSRAVSNFFLFAAVLSLIVMLPATLFMLPFVAYGTPEETMEGTRLTISNPPAIGCLGGLIYMLAMLACIFPMLGLFLINAHHRQEDLIQAGALGLDMEMSVPVQVGTAWLVGFIVLSLACRIGRDVLSLAGSDDEMEQAKGFFKLIGGLVFVPALYLVVPAWLAFGHLSFSFWALLSSMSLLLFATAARGASGTSTRS